MEKWTSTVSFCTMIGGTFKGQDSAEHDADTIRTSGHWKVWLHLAGAKGADPANMVYLVWAKSFDMLKKMSDFMT